MSEYDGKRRAAPPPDGAAPARRAAGPAGERLAGIAATLNAAAPVQRIANRTGLPDQLKTGVEAMSGLSLDHVRVHRNSDKPARLNAHAYAQGADIHLAPGQEQHLPHEAWHVVQQAQGRVKPTMQLQAGTPINDDRGLEAEADRMGARALSAGGPAAKAPVQRASTGVVQRVVWEAGQDRSWNAIVGNSNRPPSHEATTPGEVFDDSTNKTYANRLDYFSPHIADEDEKKDEDFTIEDSDEEYDDSGEDIDEEEDDTGTPKVYPELSLDERRDIERKAQRRPFETSLLTRSTKYPTRILKTSETFGKAKAMGTRTVQSGPVSITLEQIQIYEQDKPVKRERPIRVEGLVEETVTKGRGGAPDPLSGKQIYFGSGKAPKQSLDTERNSGMPDAERGHVMALELGGPDIAENIVPQWAKYQGADTWRKMEVAVLAKAKKLPKGERLNYIVEVFYKSSGDLTPTINTFSTPTGFKVTSQVIGPKGVISQTVELHEGQSHDITDEKLRERKLKDIKEEGYDPGLALAPPSTGRKRKPKDEDTPTRKPNKAPAKKKKIDVAVKKTPPPQITKPKTPRKKTPSKASPKTRKKTPGKLGKKGQR